MVQFPPAAISLLMMSILWIAASVYVIVLFKKYRHPQYIALFFASFSMIFWSSTLAFSFIFASDTLFRLCMVFFAIALSQAVLFFDLIWTESANVLRMSIVVGLGITLIFLSFVPDSVKLRDLEGYTVPYWNGLFLIASYLILIAGLGFCSQTMIILWIKMPKSMKKQMRGIIPAIMVFGPGALVGYILAGIFGLSITSMFGIAVIGYYGIRNPQMLHILPFKVHRLIVISKDSGISCFDFKWTESEISDVLLAGLVKALQNISHEILNQGNIKEVILDNGNLILKEGKEIMIGVFASKSSKYLKSCINEFTNAFENQFKELISVKNCDISKYDLANQLIIKHFANIPLDIVEIKKGTN